MDDSVALVQRFRSALAAYRNRTGAGGLARLVADEFCRSKATSWAASSSTCWNGYRTSRPGKQFLVAALSAESRLHRRVGEFPSRKARNVGSDYVRLDHDCRFQRFREGGRRVKKTRRLRPGRDRRGVAPGGYKVVSMRRNIMFRMLLESTRCCCSATPAAPPSSSAS